MKDAIQKGLSKEHYHKEEVKQIEREFNTGTTKGLTLEDATERIEKYGTNELEKEEKESMWEKIKEQFDDILVKILLVAAVISFLIASMSDDAEGISAFVEPLVILLILIANAVIGVIQDSNADQAIEALMEM